MSDLASEPAHMIRFVNTVCEVHAAAQRVPSEETLLVLTDILRMAQMRIVETQQSLEGLMEIARAVQAIQPIQPVSNVIPMPPRRPTPSPENDNGGSAA